MIDVGFPERSWLGNASGVVQASRRLAPPRSPRPLQTINHNGLKGPSWTDGAAQSWKRQVRLMLQLLGGQGRLADPQGWISRVRFSERAGALIQGEAECNHRPSPEGGDVLRGSPGSGGSAELRPCSWSTIATGKDMQVLVRHSVWLKSPELLIQSQPPGAPLRSAESQSQRRNLLFFHQRF